MQPDQKIDRVLYLMRKRGLVEVPEDLFDPKNKDYDPPEVEKKEPDKTGPKDHK